MCAITETDRRFVADVRDGIYHATSIDNYRQIRECGKIKHNDGTLSSTTDTSKLSKAVEIGGISFFDFETPDESIILNHSDGIYKWKHVLLCRPTIVMIGFKREALPLQPRCHDELEQQLGCGGILPYGLEVCYPGDVELALAFKHVLICNGNFSILDYEIHSGDTLTDTILDAVAIKHERLIAVHLRKTGRGKYLSSHRHILKNAP